MSKVLFLSIPSHGHMNPTLGLASALIDQGEKVTFFSSNEFKKSIEEIGADFKGYKADLNIFQNKPDDKTGTSSSKKKGRPGFIDVLSEPNKFIDDVLSQIKDLKFDYIVFSSAYPYATVITQLLKIPAVSSFAVFATLKDIFNKKTGNTRNTLSFLSSLLIKLKIYILQLVLYLKFRKIRQSIAEKYNVKISNDMLSQFLNKGDLNIIYTSKYFIPRIEDYDDSFLFIGPPVYKKKYTVDFPFEKLEGKQVIYISLGTVFSNYSADLNNLFFKSFADMDTIVVMAAHKVDVSKLDVPENFIIRDYVPQLEILKYTSVAITHAGMNSIGDLLYNNVPFVAIPLGADQFYLANRAQELGATIVLDINNLTPEVLRDSVEAVLTNPDYLENIKKISNSFIEAGGYKKAVEEIFNLKSKFYFSTN
jgi:MGT family glycosyltransferase